MMGKGWNGRIMMGKKTGRITFMVRHKNIKKGKVVPVNIEDLLSYLVKNSKKFKK